MEWEKRNDPDHPYCTNWPVNKKKEKMKRFKEANEEIYEMSKQEKLAHDMTLISEAGEDMCAIPIDMLKSKVMKDRHKKLCKDKKHWSTTKKGKFNPKSIWSKAAQRAAITKGYKLYNEYSLEESDLQMKSFNQYNEGWFDKKEKEDPDYEELKKLGMKAAGRGGWSKKEQEKYNDLWMKMHKKGKTPTMSPPSVYGDDSWGTKTIKLQKKLKLTQKDHSGVLA